MESIKKNKNNNNNTFYKNMLKYTKQNEHCMNLLQARKKTVVILE